MKRTKFSETQIVKAILEESAGRKAEDICREMGISRAIFYPFSEPNSFRILKDMQ